MVRTYCVDFDDLCDVVCTQRLLDLLRSIKDATPEFKVTLFSIPQRCSDATIKSMRELGDWVALAPHGWRHTRGECLGWTPEEAIAKIDLARDMGIDAACFRAPGWLLDADVYAACKQLDYVVASHAGFRIPYTGAREYIYNMHMGANPPRTRRIHGHLTNVAGNCIYDLHHNGFLTFKKDTQFVFPWEVALVIDKGIELADEGVRL